MYDPKKAQKEREALLAKLRDATTEEDETSEVVARAVEGGVRGALASIREGDDDSTPPPKKSKAKLWALLVTILSALATLATAAVAHYTGK